MTTLVFPETHIRTTASGPCRKELPIQTRWAQWTYIDPMHADMLGVLDHEKSFLSGRDCKLLPRQHLAPLLQHVRVHHHGAYNPGTVI